MKKFLWIALLFALSLMFAACTGDDPDDNTGVICEYVDCDCADCEGEGCECKKEDGGNGEGEEEQELVIDNPKFTGWGGLGSAGENNTFNFSASASNNCRVTYKFPAGADNYTSFTITFNLTKITESGDSSKPMKLIFGDRSKDQWGDSSNGYAADSTFNEYKDITTDTTAGTYTHAISANKQVTIEQNWGGSKSDSANFTLTFVEIKFF